MAWQMRTLSGARAHTARGASRGCIPTAPSTRCTCHVRALSVLYALRFTLHEKCSSPQHRCSVHTAVACWTAAAGCQKLSVVQAARVELSLVVPGYRFIGWDPDNVSYWVAVLFTLGSVAWVINGFYLFTPTGNAAVDLYASGYSGALAQPSPLPVGSSLAAIGSCQMPPIMLRLSLLSAPLWVFGWSARVWHACVSMGTT